MYKLIVFDQEEKYIHDFLRLPTELYSKREIVQNQKEERSLLLGEHVLSKYFTLHKLLVYKGDKACARCIITIYPGDDISYIGYFESIDEIECAKVLFQEVNRRSRENQCRKVKGPIDTSFWIKYRLKIDYFDEKPTISEPYNKEYYLNLFLESGYQVAEIYFSNCFDKPSLFYVNQKCKNRYDSFIEKGYQISSPKKKDFDRVIQEIYQLLMTLYKDFPVFKNISEADFMVLFAPFRYILDFSFVTMAYYKEEPVGFIIGMPDYGNLLYGKMNFISYAKLLLKKIRCSNYVMLYLGALPEHRGLGNAMAQKMIQNLQIRRANSVGSLIMEGKVTKGYIGDQVLSTRKYVLLECEL